MPARFKITLFACLLIATPLLAYEAPTKTAPRPFVYETDSFNFANETVWNYQGGVVKDQTKPDHRREFTRRCFAMSRAAVQFWKFARFDPRGAALNDVQLADRIRQVTERSVWLPSFSWKDRVVFPGYSNLREMSKLRPGSLQANIGAGWPVYFRPGNFPIAVPATLATEARLNDEIFHDLSMNTPTIVWLYTFPSLKMDHVVIIFAGRRDGSHYRYQVVDPNYHDAPKKLDYDVATRNFSYQPTYFFKGGYVTARAIYRGLVQ